MRSLYFFTAGITVDLIEVILEKIGNVLRIGTISQSQQGLILQNPADKSFDR